MDALIVRLVQNCCDMCLVASQLGQEARPLDGIGSLVRIVYHDGTRGPAREIHAGSGYWSQSSATQVLGTAPDKRPQSIEITWFDGTGQRVPVEVARGTYLVVHPDR